MKLLQKGIPAYFIGANYSGAKKAIALNFYEPNSQKLYVWFDDTHEPYCLTNLSPFELDQIEALKKHPSFKRFEIIQKYDALHDQDITVTKVIMKDPASIGGKTNDGIRYIIPDNWEGAKVWEARIHYDGCYIYDKQLEMGMPYQLTEDGKLIPVVYPDAEERIKEITSDEIWCKEAGADIYKGESQGKYKGFKYSRRT